MPTLDYSAIMQALDKADAEGNVEDANDLAEMARAALQQQQTAPASPQSATPQSASPQSADPQLPPGVPTPDPHADASYFGEMGKGLVSGPLGALAGLATSGARALISPFVQDQTLKDFDESVKQTADFNKQNYGGAPAVPTLGDIHSKRDAGLYAANKLGENAPAIGATIVGGPLAGAAVQGAVGGKQTYDATGGDLPATAVGAGVGAISGLIPTPFLKGAGAGFSTGLQALAEPTVGGIAKGLGNAALETAGGAVRGAAGGALAGGAAGALGNIPEAVHTGNPMDAIPSLGQIAEGAASGAVLGGAAGGALRALPARETAVSPQEDAAATAKAASDAAAGRLAEKIQTEAQDTGVELGKNVKYGSPRGDEAVLENVHNNLAEGLKDKAKLFKDDLDPAQAIDSADRADRVQMQGALRDARNKLKGNVSESDLALFNDRIGHTQEGQDFIDLMRQSNHLTDLFRGGMKGGISRYTDLLSPFTRGGSENGRSSLENSGDITRRGVMLAAPFLEPSGLGLSALAAGTGAAVAGRVADRALGLRSKTARFVNNNIGNAKPLDFGDRPSVIEQRNTAAQTQQALADPEAARLAQRERDLYFQKFQDNNPGLGGFLHSLHEQTGLMPQDASTGVQQLLRNGDITQSEHDMFHSEPKALMQNNVGNHMIDMLDSLARKGQIQRDPVWLASQPGNVAPQAPPQQSNVRNPEAYAAQAAANQARVGNAIARVSASSHPPAIKEAINSAAASIGRTNNRADAQVLHDNLVKALGPNAEAASLAKQELKPLVAQIKHADQAAVDRAHEGRPLTPREKVDAAQKAEHLVNDLNDSTLTEAFGADAPMLKQLFAQYLTGGRDPKVALKLALIDFTKWVDADRPSTNNRTSVNDVKAAAD